MPEIIRMKRVIMRGVREDGAPVWACADCFTSDWNRSPAYRSMTEERVRGEFAREHPGVKGKLDILDWTIDPQEKP